MVVQCSLIAWVNGLASRDQHQLKGSSSALEAITRNALYKSMFTLLTSTVEDDRWMNVKVRK